MGIIQSNNIKSVYEIGGYNYLHYYFSNSRMDIQDFQAAKRASYFAQRGRLINRMATMIHGDLKEGFDILNDITQNGDIGSGLDKEISAIFGKQQMPSGADDSGLGGYSYLALRNHVKGLATKFIQDYSIVQDKMQQALNQIVDSYSKAYPDLVKIALAEAANYQNNTSTKQIIQDFLISGNKILSLPGNIASDQQAMMQSIARLKVMTDTIPEIAKSNIKAKDFYYTRSHGPGGKQGISNKSQLISVLLGKVGGTLNSLGGSVEEIAVGHGLASALQKTNITLVRDSKAFFVGGQVRLDPQLIQDSEFDNGFTMNKSDVVLNVVGEKVTASFGVSVKNSQKINSAGIATEIKLHTGTNLLSVLGAAQQQGVSEYYIYNLAGGHEDDNISAGSLQEGWKNLVDYAVALNFLDYIAGNGGVNNNNLILVVNRKIYSISSILSKLAQTPDAVNYTGGKRRYVFRDLNQWIFNFFLYNTQFKTLAQRRSYTSWQKIRNQMINTKMNISLNLAMLT